MGVRESDVAMFAILIPIFCVIGGIILASIALRHRAKRNELEHQERMAAIEKGVPLPPAAMPPPRREHNPYLWGLILLVLGLALVIGALGNGEENLKLELGVMSVGLAILLANWLFLRDRKRKEKRLDSLTSGPEGLNGTPSDLR